MNLPEAGAFSGRHTTTWLALQPQSSPSLPDQGHPVGWWGQGPINDTAWSLQTCCSLRTQSKAVERWGQAWEGISWQPPPHTCCARGPSCQEGRAGEAASLPTPVPGPYGGGGRVWQAAAQPGGPFCPPPSPRALAGVGGGRPQQPLPPDPLLRHPGHPHAEPPTPAPASGKRPPHPVGPAGRGVRATLRARQRLCSRPAAPASRLPRSRRPGPRASPRVPAVRPAHLE